MNRLQNTRNDPKKTWRLLNNFLDNVSPPNIIQQIEHNAITYTDTTAIVEILNHSFLDIKGIPMQEVIRITLI